MPRDTAGVQAFGGGVDDNGGQWLLLSLWGLRLSLYFCVCAEGGVPCAYTCSCRCPCLCTYTKGRASLGLFSVSLYLMPLRQGLPLCRGSLCFACAQWWAALEIFSLHLLPTMRLQVSTATRSFFFWDLDPELHAWAVRAITY